MSKSVKLVVDGVALSMVSDAPKEHVDKVNTYVNEVINSIKGKNNSLNSLNAYRYTMVYLADQVIEMRELVDIDGLKKNVSDNEIKDLRRKTQLLQEDNQELMARLNHLQMVLTEKSKKIEALQRK